MPKPEKKKQRRDSSSSSSESMSESEKQPIKKSKNADSFRTDDKEPTWDLGKNKFAKISDFKGKVYVNIREFYDAGGELKPGKKGIMLTGEQWIRFKASVNEIDEEFKKKC